MENNVPIQGRRDTIQGKVQEKVKEPEIQFDKTIPTPGHSTQVQQGKDGITIIRKNIIRQPIQRKHIELLDNEVRQQIQNDKARYRQVKYQFFNRKKQQAVEDPYEFLEEIDLQIVENKEKLTIVENGEQILQKVFQAKKNGFQTASELSERNKTIKILGKKSFIIKENKLFNIEYDDDVLQNKLFQIYEEKFRELHKDVPDYTQLDKSLRDLTDESLYSFKNNSIFRMELIQNISDLMKSEKNGQSQSQKNIQMEDFKIKSIYNISLGSSWSTQKTFPCSFKLCIYQLPLMTKIKEQQLFLPCKGDDYEDLRLELQEDKIQVWMKDYIFQCNINDTKQNQKDRIILKLNNNQSEPFSLPTNIAFFGDLVFFILKQGILKFDVTKSGVCEYISYLPQKKDSKTHQDVKKVILQDQIIYAFSNQQIVSIRLPDLEREHISTDFFKPQEFQIYLRSIIQLDENPWQITTKQIGKFIINFATLGSLNDLKNTMISQEKYEDYSDFGIERFSDELDRACVHNEDDPDNHFFFIFDRGINVKNQKPPQINNELNSQGNEQSSTDAVNNENHALDNKKQKTSERSLMDKIKESSDKMFLGIDGILKQRQQKKFEKVSKYNHTFPKYEYLKRSEFIMSNNSFYMLVYNVLTNTLMNIKLQRQYQSIAAVRQINYDEQMQQSSLIFEDPCDIRFRQVHASNYMYRYAFKCQGKLVLISYLCNQEKVSIQLLVVIKNLSKGHIDVNQKIKEEDEKDDVYFQKQFFGKNHMLYSIRNLEDNFQGCYQGLNDETTFFTSDNTDLVLIFRDDQSDFFITTLLSRHQLPFERHFDRKVNYILSFTRSELVTFDYSEMKMVKYTFTYTIYALQLDAPQPLIKDHKQIFKFYFQNENDYQFKKEKVTFDNIPLYKNCYVMALQSGFLFFNSNLEFQGHVSLVNSGKRVGQQLSIKNNIQNQDINDDQHDNYSFQQYLTIEDQNIILWDPLSHENKTFKFNNLDDFLINPEINNHMFPLEIDFDNMKLKITGYKRKAMSCFSVNHSDLFISYLNEKLAASDFENAVDQAQDSYFSMFYEGNQNLLDIFYSVSPSDFKKLIDKIVDNKREEFNPFIFIKSADQQCFLKLALEQNLYKNNVQVYIDTASDKFANPFFNSHIEQHLIKLMKFNYNVENYLQSTLAYYQCETSMQIDNINEPYFIKSDQEMTLKEVIDTLDIKIKAEIDKRKLENVDNNIAESFLTYIINIPSALSSQYFIPTLAEHENETIFDVPLIQSVLDFKWHCYCKWFFRIQFILFCLFITCFLIDVYFFVIQKDERDVRQVLAVKIGGLMYICYLIWYEIKSIIFSKWEYFKDVYNYNDFLLVVSYVLIFIFDALSLYREGLQILYSVTLMFCFFKSINLLRQFKGFNFLISMLLSVFKDLKYFIMLYGMVLAIYGIIFTILEIQPSTDELDYYSGINLAGYIIMSFRASIGDFQIDNFNLLNEQLIIFTWIVWISAVMVLNVILLNFIIAVISSSYEKVLQSKVQNQYKLITQLILERETHYGYKETCPRFLIVRTPASVEAKKAVEWEGHIKSLKKELQKVTSYLDKIPQNKDAEIKYIRETLDELKAQEKDKYEELKNILHSHSNQQNKFFENQIAKWSNDFISREASNLLKTQKLQNIQTIIAPQQPINKDKQDDDTNSLNSRDQA